MFGSEYSSDSCGDGPGAELEVTFPSLKKDPISRFLPIARTLFISDWLVTRGRLRNFWHFCMTELLTKSIHPMHPLFLITNADQLQFYTGAESGPLKGWLTIMLHCGFFRQLVALFRFFPLFLSRIS